MPSYRLPTIPSEEEFNIRHTSIPPPRLPWDASPQQLYQTNAPKNSEWIFSCPSQRSIAKRINEEHELLRKADLLGDFQYPEAGLAVETEEKQPKEMEAALGILKATPWIYHPRPVKEDSIPYFMKETSCVTPENEAHMKDLRRRLEEAKATKERNPMHRIPLANGFRTRYDEIRNLEVFQTIEDLEMELSAIPIVPGNGIGEVSFSMPSMELFSCLSGAGSAACLVPPFFLPFQGTPSAVHPVAGQRTKRSPPSNVNSFPYSVDAGVQCSSLPSPHTSEVVHQICGATAGESSDGNSTHKKATPGLTSSFSSSRKSGPLALSSFPHPSCKQVAGVPLPFPLLSTLDSNDKVEKKGNPS